MHFKTVESLQACRLMRKKRLFLETDCVCPVYMSQVESMSSECKMSSGRRGMRHHTSVHEVDKRFIERSKTKLGIQG